MTTTHRRLIKRAFVLTLIFLTVIWIWKQRSFPILQLRTLIIAVIAYLIWAALHHYFNKSLTMEVYIEYLLTAVLALILLIGVLL